jgi:hypothetical protein
MDGSGSCLLFSVLLVVTHIRYGICRDII